MCNETNEAVEALSNRKDTVLIAEKLVEIAKALDTELTVSEASTTVAAVLLAMHRLEQSPTMDHPHDHGEVRRERFNIVDDENVQKGLDEIKGREAQTY
jgi:hypothetical protein